jgi:lysophospholipase L1-like esterase
MKAYRRFSTLWQMAAALCAFAALSLLLESGALLAWAQRLELGPERTLALPVVVCLHRRLQPLGIERERSRGLAELSRIGWSDDPAQLAQQRPASSAAAVPVAAMIKPAPAPASQPLPGKLGTSIDPDGPPLVTALPGLTPVPQGGTRTVALAGDSMMAVGLSAAILREVPRYKDLTTVHAFKSGTGLARPEVFDWQAEYPAMVGNARPDVVLVAIGANDGQGFVEGDTTYAFGTEGWKKVYRRRVQAFLSLLESGGATVVWLELPPMKNAELDRRMAIINRIDYETVQASPRAVWFSTAGVVGDETGHFRELGIVRGATVSLRQADGIHLSDQGALLLADKLLPWLSKQAEPKAQ